MRLIVVDPSPAYRVAVRRHLATAFPRVEVTEYDPDQQGLPPADFDWRLFDFVLLSQELGPGSSGLEWLRHYSRTPGFPPAALVAAAGDEYLAVSACRAGARDYLRRADVAGPRLLEVVREATRDGAAERTVTLAGERDACPTLDQAGHRFVRLIGHGGFARVYLAERLRDRELVVLKVMDAARGRQGGALRRFLREADIIRAIDDPHVVRLYERGMTSDYAYISMEFFPRGCLKKRLESGLAMDDAVRHLRDIALGLKAIHARQVVHRDIKPGNIMFRADDTLALADFGISRRLDDDSDLTSRFGAVGTPSYISPEQALGEVTDARADLYSLGAIFFELLTGRKPFVAPNVEGVLHQHVAAPVPRLPPAACAAQPVVDLLLAKDRRDRPQSADELVELIDQWWPAPRGLSHAQK